MFNKNFCVFIIYMHIIFIYLLYTALICFYIVTCILLNSSRFLTLSFEKLPWEKKNPKKVYLREKSKSLENEMQS